MTTAAESSATLAEVVITEQLIRRPSRPADFQSENLVLRNLARQMASEPDQFLQRVVDAALQAARAGSAGVTLFETGADGQPVFRWAALAGAFSAFTGRLKPPAANPCQIALERQAPQLFSYPSRYFADLGSELPTIVEALVVPFTVEGRPIGTLWVLSHTADSQFDREDLRVLSGLADFTSAGLRLSTIALENARMVQQAETNLHVREQAEEKARLINQSLRTFIYSSPLPIVVIDDDSPVVRLWNPAAERLFGWREREVLGRIIPHVPQEKLGEYEAYRAATAMGKTFHDIDTWRRRKDGSDVEVDVLAAPLVDPDGVGECILLLYSDESQRKKTAAALRDSEERLSETELRYRLIMQSADAAVWDRDLVMNQIMWNEGMQLRFGYAADLVGPRADWWVQRIHPDDRQRVLDGMRQVIDSGAESWQDEYRFQRANGTWADVFDRGHLVHNDHTKAFRMVGFMMDLSERKRAERMARDSERIYRAIGDSIDYGVWVCNAEGDNLYASDSFLNLIGMTQAECAGLGWTLALDSEDSAAMIEAWRKCVAEGSEWDREHSFKGADGQRHPILARGVPVRNEQGDITSWVGIHLDIRRLKDAEQALKEADRRKDEFLATLAHELRNPLAPIRNAVEVLQLKDSPDPELRWASGVIDRQMGQMTRLIDDLLDVSRITRNKLELRKERIALADVIEAAIETSRPLIDHAGHDLVVELPTRPVYVEGDLTRLAQVFLNLLNNAAKYSERGSRIWLSVTPQDDHVQVTIRDNGVGIPKEMLPRIFELFTQVNHSLARSQGGLGIGLNLVKRLVDMHGGTISAWSAGEGQGSQFVDKLPVSRGVQGRASSVNVLPSPTIAPAKLKILVVDDNQDSAQSMSMMLQMMGYATETVHDGESAIRAARDFRPRIVLLDIGLPKMNGYEVCRYLRKEPWAGDLQIVALTGWGQEDDRRQAREAGFDRHLVKPVDPAVLTQVLREAAAKHH